MSLRMDFTGRKNNLGIYPILQGLYHSYEQSYELCIAICAKRTRFMLKRVSDLVQNAQKIGIGDLVYWVGRACSGRVLSMSYVICSQGHRALGSRGSRRFPREGGAVWHTK